MFFKRILYFLPAIILVAVFLEACSDKGCTDKNAINYNIVANKDDNSCEFCDSTNMQTGQESVFVTDWNSSGSHYGEVIAKFVVTQKSLKYNYSSCGDDKCSITYTVENLCNQDFDLSYNLHYSGSSLFFSTNNFMTVATNQTSNIIEITESEINNPCGNLSPSGSLNVSSVSIVYH